MQNWTVLTLVVHNPAREAGGHGVAEVLRRQGGGHSVERQVHQLLGKVLTEERQEQLQVLLLLLTRRQRQR